MTMTDQQHIRKVYRRRWIAAESITSTSNDSWHYLLSVATLVLALDTEPGERESDRAGEGEDRDAKEEQG